MKFKCCYCNTSSFKKLNFKPKDWEYFYKGPINNSARYFTCCFCESKLLLPTPSQKALYEAYPTDYQLYKPTKSKKSLTKIFLSKLVNILDQLRLNAISKNLTKQSTILDYACGNGSLISLLTRNGFKNSFGYEPSKINSRLDSFSSSYLLSSEEELSSIAYKLSKFDLIIMSHIIEHVINPRLLLENMILNYLKEDGEIIGETPLANHISMSLFNSFAGTLHYPYHISLATPESLKVLVKNLNTNIDIKFEPVFQPTGWSMSFENLLKKYIFKSHRGRTPLYIFFVLLGMPLSIFEYIISVFSKKIFTSIFRFKIKLNNS